MSVRMNLCGHRTIIEKTKITGKSHINISIRLTLHRGSLTKIFLVALMSMIQEWQRMPPEKFIKEKGISLMVCGNKDQNVF